MSEAGQSTYSEEQCWHFQFVKQTDDEEPFKDYSSLRIAVFRYAPSDQIFFRRCILKYEVLRCAVGAVLRYAFFWWPTFNSPFSFRSHTCITFELLSINLYELIKKNKFQGFSLQLVRKFAHSLLQCLDTLYRNKIIHCDMKPENVLLKQQGRSGIKVGTFRSLSMPVCLSTLWNQSSTSSQLLKPRLKKSLLFTGTRIQGPARTLCMQFYELEVECCC